LINWNAFTPWSALGGGLLIGAAAAMLILLNGRVAGVSGVLGGLLRLKSSDTAWRLAFILGLVVTPALFIFAGHDPGIEIESSYPVLIIAGLLVGAGTRYGSGCTSGHGVCGLSRLSPRSLAATLSFMAAGFLTVYVVRHLMGV